MHDARLVRLGEAGCDLAGDPDELVGRKRTLTEPIPERLPFDQLHGDVVDVVLLVDVVNGEGQ